MFIILFFTILGFLVGLCYVMTKRRIKPGKILTGTFLVLIFMSLWNVLKGYYKKKGGRRW